MLILMRQAFQNMNCIPLLLRLGYAIRKLRFISSVGRIRQENCILLLQMKQKERLGILKANQLKISQFIRSLKLFKSSL